jgi:hypothetical protein
MNSTQKQTSGGAALAISPQLFFTDAQFTSELKCLVPSGVANKRV